MESKTKKKKKSKKKLIIIGIIVVLVLFNIVNFIQNKAKREAEENKVLSENVERRTIVKSISATGTIKSTNTKEYTTTLVGKNVKSVNVKVGDIVNVGDSLVTFDIKDLNDSLKLAQDGLNIAREQTNLGISAAEKGVNSATDTRNSQGSNLDKSVKDIENSIGKIDSQIASAKVASDAFLPMIKASEASLEIVKNKNNPIINNYNNKTIEYNNSVKELEIYKINFDTQQKSYEKYFNAITGVQLDPVTGLDIPKDKYQDGDYATTEHKNIYTNFKALENNYQTTLQNLQNKVNGIKNEVDGLVSGYNIAKAENDNEEKKYNDLLNQRQTVEATISSLESSKLQLTSQLEQAKATADSTKKSLDSAVDQARTSLENSKLTAQSTILSQESQIKTVREQAEKGTLKSDVAGTVTSINVKDGDIYQGGTILKIEGCETFMIEAQIDEYDIADIKVGMKVKIKTDATRNEELQGKVTFVAPTATESMVGNGMSLASATVSSGATYKIEISIDSINDRLRIGMNAKLSIITEEVENALTVPYDAVETKEDGKDIIKILEEDGVTETEIEVTKGLESDYYTEIKSDKVKEGMKVIVPDTGSGDAMSTLINSMQASTGI